MKWRSGATWGLMLGVPAGVFAVLLARQLVAGGFAELGVIVTTQHGLLLNTALYGALTAVAATVLGWMLAHVHHLYDFRGRTALHWLSLAPLVMPSFTFAMALVILLGHNGWLTSLLGAGVEVYGLGGLVVAGTLARLPYAYVMLLLAYRGMSADLMDAAAGLGASPRRVLRAVIWPRLRLPVLTVMLLTFADTAADLANPLVVGGGFRVVSSRLYEAVVGEGDLAVASAYTVLLLAPALAYWLVGRGVGDARPALARRVPGLGRRPNHGGVLIVAVSWAVGLLIAVLLGVVGVAAVAPQGGPVGFSAFAGLLADPGYRAMAWSVLIACVVVPLALAAALLGMLAVAPDPVWVVRAQRWCGALVAVPNIVAGFGGFLAFLAVRGLFGDSTAWRTIGVVVMLAIVLMLRIMPQAALAMLAPAHELVPDIRGAGASLGARGWRLVRLVYLPRLRDPIRNTVVLSAARALTATSSVLFLSDVQVPLATPRMLIDIDAGQIAAAAAMTVVIGGLIGVVGVLAQWGWNHE